MSVSPIILGVDASAGACSVALSMGDAVIGEQLIEARGHAEILLDLVDQLLAQAGLARSQIDAIAYGSGPGGFTGVRVSAGVAQGIAMGLDCPGIALSTLRIVAASNQIESTHACYMLVALDARMGEVYAQSFYRQATDPIVLEDISPALLCLPEALTPPSNDWVGIGNGFLAYPGLASQGVKAQQISAHVMPNIAAAMPLARAQYECNAVQAPSDIAPVYLRNQIAKPSV